MSWTIVAQILDSSPNTKYKITAFHKGDAGALSSELVINREQVMNNYIIYFLPYLE